MCVPRLTSTSRTGDGGVVRGDDGHAPVRRHLERKRKSRNAAAEDEEVEWFHRTGKLAQRPGDAKRKSLNHLGPKELPGQQSLGGDLQNAGRVGIGQKR